MCSSSNYNQLPDQEKETFVWSNKAGDCYELCTLKKYVLNNIGHSWRPAANICFSDGLPTKAQQNAKSPVDTWSFMIPDDEVMKIVNYTNKKVTELYTIIGEQLREMDKKIPLQVDIIDRNESMVWVVVFACSIEAQYDRHGHCVV